MKADNHQNAVGFNLEKLSIRKALHPRTPSLSIANGKAEWRFFNELDGFSDSLHKSVSKL